jgi:hypothetical protein
MLRGVIALVLLILQLYRLFLLIATAQSLRDRKLIDDGESLDCTIAVQSTLPTIRNLSPDSAPATSVSATCQFVRCLSAGLRGETAVVESLLPREGLEPLAAADAVSRTSKVLPKAGER